MKTIALILLMLCLAACTDRSSGGAIAPDDDPPAAGCGDPTFRCPPKRRCLFVDTTCTWIVLPPDTSECRRP